MGKLISAYTHQYHIYIRVSCIEALFCKAYIDLNKWAAAQHNKNQAGDKTMKTIIATTTIIALSLTAPAFATVTDARAHFAAGNTSPLESRVITKRSVGNTRAAHSRLALDNDSARERIVRRSPSRPTRTRNRALLSFFAKTNSSPLESNR